MRKYLSFIIDAPDEEKVGKVIIRDSPGQTMAEKNQPGPTDYRNLETNETWTEQEVGLGYHDFEDEEDYQENLPEVVDAKLEDIDDEHLEAAGIER